MKIFLFTLFFIHTSTIVLSHDFLVHSEISAADELGDDMIFNPVSENPSSTDISIPIIQLNERDIISYYISACRGTLYQSRIISNLVNNAGAPHSQTTPFVNPYCVNYKEIVQALMCNDDRVCGGEFHFRGQIDEFTIARLAALEYCSSIAVNYLEHPDLLPMYYGPSQFVTIGAPEVGGIAAPEHHETYQITDGLYFKCGFLASPFSEY